MFLRRSVKETDRWGVAPMQAARTFIARHDASMIRLSNLR